MKHLINDTDKLTYKTETGSQTWKRNLRGMSVRRDELRVWHQQIQIAMYKIKSTRFQ